MGLTTSLFVIYVSWCEKDDPITMIFESIAMFVVSCWYILWSIIIWNTSLQRLLKMVDGLNFKDFVAFLSTFSAKASTAQKIERMSLNLYMCCVLATQGKTSYVGVLCLKLSWLYSLFRLNGILDILLSLIAVLYY